MGTDARQVAIIDACVLINFLAVGRTDLLARHPAYRFHVTNHVRAEITDHYPEQLARLDTALAAGEIHETNVSDPEELAAFGELVKTGIGVGECSAIAAAVVHERPLAIDDKQARKHALRFCPTLALMDTQAIVVTLIKANHIDVAAADAIKQEWQTSHSFTLKFGSFAELL